MRQPARARASLSHDGRLCGHTRLPESAVLTRSRQSWGEFDRVRAGVGKMLGRARPTLSGFRPKLGNGTILTLKRVLSKVVRRVGPRATSDQ